MTTQPFAGTTALVTGAGRGFGRAIATALAAAGANVVGVARDRAALEEVRAQIGDAFTPEVADVADPVAAGHLIDTYSPRTLVLNAGATPLTRPIQHQSWESFSRTWDVDVRQAFHWTREALLRPLDPGSLVMAFSSGASLHGSPLSGGYAGAKAAVRFVSAYAADESDRESLGLTFVSVLPKLTPNTDHGAKGVAAYAARQGVSVEAYVDSIGPVLTPEQVGAAVSALALEPGPNGAAYLLTAAGLSILG